MIAHSRLKLFGRSGKIVEGLQREPPPFVTNRASVAGSHIFLAITLHFLIRASRTPAQSGPFKTHAFIVRWRIVRICMDFNSASRAHNASSLSARTERHICTLQCEKSNKTYGILLSTKGDGFDPLGNGQHCRDVDPRRLRRCEFYFYCGQNGVA